MACAWNTKFIITSAMRALAIQLMCSILRLLSVEVKPAENLLLRELILTHMLLDELAEAEVDGLRGTAQCVRNVRERQVLVTAEADHLTLLSHRPAVVVTSVDGAGRGGERALRRGRGTGLHLVVRGNMPSS